jgi:C4-dicarboxylate-specific signal transduction histidine kinase
VKASRPGRTGLYAALLFLLATTVASVLWFASMVAELGMTMLIFVLPVGAVIWGVTVLVHARLTQRRLSVAVRLSAFFTAAVGTVFVLLSGLVLGTFAVRYTEAVASGQKLLGRSTVLTFEEVLRRGESLRLSLVPEATLVRLLEQSPNLAYASLLELRNGERRQIRSVVRADAERFRATIERELETEPVAGSRHWQSGSRTLRVENVVVPVLDTEQRLVAELHLGIDRETIARQVRELALLIGGVTLLIFIALLLLLRQYAARGLVEPLRRVRGALERIARGDASLNDRLQVSGDQELAEVAAFFNAFADRLVEIIQTTRATATENAHLFQQQKETAERLRAQAEELEHAYEQLRRSQEQLLVSEKMAALGKLTAGIAHEINSPLGGILNAVEVAETYAQEYWASAVDSEVTPEDHRAIATDLLSTLKLAKSATQKVAQFVQTIKGQTRIREERLLPFDPAEEIRSTLVLLSHELKYRNVSVETDLQPGLRLEGDPANLGLVVQNLVSNAVGAYDGRDSAVWIRLWREDGSIVLEVEDHGSGIPEQIRARIFDYMFTTKDVGEGTGLGLSMVYSIVTSHFRGSIDVETEVGRGTVFRVRIPERPEPRAVAPAEDAA